MSYFVTGASGFIGRHLIEHLAKRKGDIYVLVRQQSLEKLDDLIEQWQIDKKRIHAIVGDISAPGLALKKADSDRLKGKIHHVFHLAAVYDLTLDAESQQAANIDGTRNTVKFAEAINAKCFNHTSSIAAAGLYQGIFREDMFDEARGLDHPYFSSKHESEGIVRRECSIPWRIYRPGIVIGSSQTGEIDKIDGPYYFFKLIQKMRAVLPAWMPTIGLEGGRINLVPVDYVAAAMDHIAHQKDLDGKCFHLTDPNPKRIGEVLNIFAKAGHAPQMTMRIDSRMFQLIPSFIKQGLSMLPPLQRITDQILGDLGIPREMLKLINYPTRFDSNETQRALKNSSIKLPKLEKYAWKLWDYWERNLDPDLFKDRSLSGQVKGKKVMVTGASSGIGKAVALRLAKAGAEVICVARTAEKLEETRLEIEELKGISHIYTADVSDMVQCDDLVKRVIEDLGGVDILINNAGRSIRRSIVLSFDRFHDFERTMQLNYFGSLRLIMGFLPTMLEKGQGQVINISSIGVLSNAPRFSAYVSSKAALDAFSRCAAAELSDSNVSFSTINMPLVRTPMIAPTKIYQNVPTISPEEASEYIEKAIIYKPQRIATRLGIFSQVIHMLAPKLWEITMNSAFRLFPDSAAAKGESDAGEAKSSNEMVAFASIMRGVHW